MYLPRPDGWNESYKKAALAAGMSADVVAAALRECGACKWWDGQAGHSLRIAGICLKKNYYCLTERTFDSSFGGEMSCGPQGRWWEPK